MGHVSRYSAAKRLPFTGRLPSGTNLNKWPTEADGQGNTNVKRLTALLATSLLLAAAPLASQGATIVHQATHGVLGMDTVEDVFTVPVAGPYQILVTDRDGPGDVFQPFEILKVGLAECSTCTFIREAELPSPFVFSFDGAPGVEYVIDFFAKVANSTSGGTGVGIFHYDVALVPIPASVLLLGSAMLGLVVVRRRRSAEAGAA